MARRYAERCPTVSDRDRQTVIHGAIIYQTVVEGAASTAGGDGCGNGSDVVRGEGEERERVRSWALMLAYRCSILVEASLPLSHLGQLHWSLVPILPHSGHPGTGTWSEANTDSSAGLYGV